VAARDHVILLCAGNAGELSLEDHICAGLYVSRLAGPDTELNDAALAARAAYRSVEPDLGRFLLSSAHAHRLTRLGFGPDLALALRIDTLPLAAVFRAGRIEVPAP
jgi:2-phosphosulfolactate phosphatase